MKKSHKLPHAAVNVIITALIVALYFSLNGNFTLPTISTNVIYRGEADDKLSLQCVVSYDAASLEQILDTLRARKTRITFIVSGGWAKKNADMLKRMVDDGHEIATMGMSHSAAVNLERDIADSFDAIEETLGKKPTFYYVGEQNEANASLACEKTGISGILCTVDLLCSRGSSADIIERAKKRLGGGYIVTIAPTRELNASLCTLLDMYWEAGLSVVPTGEIVFGTFV